MFGMVAYSRQSHTGKKLLLAICQAFWACWFFPCLYSIRHRRTMQTVYTLQFSGWRFSISAIACALLSSPLEFFPSACVSSLYSQALVLRQVSFRVLFGVSAFGLFLHPAFLLSLTAFLPSFFCPALLVKRLTGCYAISACGLSSVPAHTVKPFFRQPGRWRALPALPAVFQSGKPIVQQGKPICN